MKKLTVDVAPNVGVLVLVLSLVGMVVSLSTGESVGPLTEGGLTLGVILLGWGAFQSFGAKEDSGVPLSEAVEQIRLARLS